MELDQVDQKGQDKVAVDGVVGRDMEALEALEVEALEGKTLHQLATVVAPELVDLVALELVATKVPALVDTVLLGGQFNRLQAVEILVGISTIL
jgi:hypothetical protein